MIAGREFTKICVWNTAFLGDAVLTLPLIRTLRKRYPKSEIHYWVRSGFEELFTAQPEIDAVKGFIKRGRGASASLLATARTAAREHYDLWIGAHRSFRSGLTAFLAGCPVRIGYSTPVFNRGLYTTTVERRFRELHEIERLLELAKPLGIKDVIHDPDPVYGREYHEKAAAFFAKLKEGPILGIHPGSVWPTKRWPTEYYAEVAGMAASEGVKVVLFGGPGDESTVQEVYAAISPALQDKVVNMAGRLSLPETAAFLERLDCYLGNDSGPMHLAWSSGTPTVAVFGPTVRELGFFPRGESIVLESAVECRPCGLHGGRRCRGKGHACMLEIRPQQVLQAVLRMSVGKKENREKGELNTL